MPQAADLPLRLNERKKIVKFANEWSHFKKLLICIGLPGIGKKELIRQALAQIRREQEDVEIHWPQLCLNASKHMCTISEIVRNICQCLFVCHDDLPSEDEQSLEMLRHVLLMIDKRSILVLELQSVNLSSEDCTRIWTVIDRVLSSASTIKIKVIASCLRHPDLGHCDDKLIECIYLRELDEDLAVQLLQNKCKELSDEDALCLVKYIGGIPSFLVKVGRILARSSCNKLEREIEKLLQKFCHPKSFGKCISTRCAPLVDEMKKVIRSLEENELETLCVIVSSCGSVRADDVGTVFGVQSNDDVEHLETSHCILECQENVFTINPIVHCLMKEIFIKDDKLSGKFHSAERKYLSFYLDLVMDCALYFFGTSKIVPHIWERLLLVRQNCKICPMDVTDVSSSPARPSSAEFIYVSPVSDYDVQYFNQSAEVCIFDKTKFKCNCSQYMLMCRLIKNHMKDIVYVLKRGSELNEEIQKQTIYTAIYALPLLCEVMEFEDLFQIFSFYLSLKDEIQDKLTIAALLSSIIYLHLLCGVSCENEAGNYMQYIQYADNVFEWNRLCLTELEMDIWARTILMHGYLACVVDEDSQYAASLVEKGLSIRSELNDQMILFASAHIELAKIHIRQGSRDMAQDDITTALEIFNEFDRHPWSIECYKQLGNLLLAAEQVQDAISHYEQALAIGRLSTHNQGTAVDIFLLLGVASFQGNEYVAGLQYFERAFAAGIHSHIRHLHLYDRFAAISDQMDIMRGEIVMPCQMPVPQLRINEEHASRHRQLRKCYSKYERELLKYIPLLDWECEENEVADFYYESIACSLLVLMFAIYPALHYIIFHG